MIKVPSWPEAAWIKCCICISNKRSARREKSSAVTGRGLILIYFFEKIYINHRRTEIDMLISVISRKVFTVEYKIIIFYNYYQITLTAV